MTVYKTKCIKFLNIRKIVLNISGLKFLVRLCTDLGLKEAQDYATKLKKAEKNQRLREEVKSSSNVCLCTVVENICVLMLA